MQPQASEMFRTTVLLSVTSALLGFTEESAARLCDRDGLMNSKGKVRYKHLHVRDFTTPCQKLFRIIYNKKFMNLYGGAKVLRDLEASL
jgi:hypothetical protein